ncbi:cytochrome c biogenesis CcdA family protein [Pseudonocardia nigra]|uniref:cytochrome c biogenesis CcdA family protein n=1 Tax=Pseudonocardia nigra TaxID=1921578 RepID=UPI001C5CED77|nr:cytochrome c biogenesis protein CcdA [Pseudonocardia nigra]
MSTATLAFALVAGAVAAFNPCGFALLPAYLGLLVAEAPGGRRAALLRAARFAAGMTLGFVAVFGLAGAAIVPLALSMERYLPVVTVVMGLLLVGLGGWLLTGRHLGVPGLAGHGTAPNAGWWSQFGYGVSFALASLSCTIAPFLAVTAGALTVGGALAVTLALLAYAAGMGIVVLALAVAVAAARTSAVSRMRRAGAVIGRISGVLLMLAGGYVAWYGWFEIRVLAGAVTSDPIVSAAVSVQAALSRVVAGLGPVGLLGVAAATALPVAALLVRRAAAHRREPVE